ncbi:phosphoenolpyruvate--protein phosphotransferase, partial [Rhizobium leguminosarum]
GDMAGGATFEQRDAAAFRPVVGEKAARLHIIAEGADDESRDIIDFQIEVLRDPTIAEATGASLEDDENVVFAWVATLD